MNNIPLHTVSFGGIDRRTILFFEDQLVCDDLTIHVSDIVEFCVVQNPLMISSTSSSFTSSISHYDLEIRTLKAVYDFPNTGLIPESNRLSILEGIYINLPFRQITPIAQIDISSNEIGGKKLQLFSDRIRLRNFNYSHWPDQRIYCNLSTLQEIKIVRRSKWTSDLFFKSLDQELQFEGCINGGVSNFVTKLLEMQPNIVVNTLEPFASVKYRNTKSKTDLLIANEEGLLWEGNYVLYRDMKSLLIRQASQILWELEFHTDTSTYLIPGILAKNMLLLKDVIEAINPKMRLTTQGEMSIEESWHLVTSGCLTPVLLAVSIVVIFGVAYFILKSDLPSTISQQFTQLSQKPQRETTVGLLPYQMVPLLGVILFGAVYSMARNIKERILDRKPICNDLTGKSAAENIAEFRGLNLRIVQIGNESEDRYDPLTQVLCLSTSTLESKSLSILVVVAHEVAHFEQSKWIGNSFLRIIKSLEALIKKLAIYIIVLFGIAVVGIALMGLFNHPAGQFILVVFIIIFFVEIMVMGVSLLVEMDADRRAHKILKRSNLIEKVDISFISRYLFCLTIMRMLLFLAFFIPNFGTHFLNFQRDKTIKI